MKIYASLTTIPSRLDKIDEPLRAILKDDFEGVFLNLPLESRRGRPYPQESIDALVKRMDSKKLIITRVDVDHGPITKLVGSLHRVEPGDFIVVFDDDRVAKKSVCKVFRREFENNPNAVYSLGGWIRGGFPRRYRNVLRNKTTVPVDSLMGVTCIGFRANTIDRDQLLGFRSEDKRLDNLDDMRISGYLASRGIVRFSIGADPKDYLSDLYMGTESLSGSMGFWFINKQVMDDFHREGLFSTKSAFDGVSIEAFVLFILFCLFAFGFFFYKYKSNARLMGILVILILFFLIITVNWVSYLTL